MVSYHCSEITENNAGARNLAIANRSRVGIAHNVTAVNFQGREYFMTEFFSRETYGTPMMAAAATSIYFRVG